jgi:hypothetical protein
MKYHLFLITLAFFLLAGCGRTSAPTPDAIATQVAMNRAVAATLTAEAPTATPTSTPTFTPTATDTPIPTNAPIPTDTPIATSTPSPSLNADVPLESCRLTLDDLPIGFSLVESDSFDQRNQTKPDGWVDLISQLTGNPELTMIAIDRVKFTDGETNIVQTMGTFQGPVRAHEVALDAQDWWSLYGMFEPFQLSIGSFGDETFAYYHRVTSEDGGWICRVAVRYDAGISVLLLGLSGTDQSQQQVITLCEELLQKTNRRIEQCSTNQ